MKKSLGLLMIVIAVIAMAFVSCDASTAPKADAVGEVVLDSSQSRGISVTVDNTVDVETLYWYYKAEKKDNGLFNTGVTNGFVPVKKPVAGVDQKGLQNANLGLFSYGNWEFTLRGVVAPINGNTIADADIMYSGSQTIDVNKDKNFLNLTLIEGNGLTTEIKFDTNEGIWFSHSNIVTGKTFSLTAVDYVNGVEKGTITSGSATVEAGKVSFKSMSYAAPEEGVAEGQHVMRFTLTQNDVASNIATVATYELTYTVTKGYTHTIKGDLTSAEVKGEAEVDTYAKSVPETTATLVLPVTVSETGSSKTVKDETTVSTLDLSVTYPAATVLTTETNTAGSGDNVTADAKIGFVLQTTNNSNISINTASQTQTTYELTLNVDSDNGTLVVVSKFIGKNLEIEGVYHDSNELPSTNGERYTYNPESGILTLYVKHASPIDIVTKKALAVAEIGEEKFTTLQAAIDASDDAEIKILENISLIDSPITIPKGKVITIDTAGHTIKSIWKQASASAAFEVKPGAILKLTGNGSIEAYAENPDVTWAAGFPGYANNAITNRGTLIIDGANVLVTTDKVGEDGHLGASYCIDSYAGSTLTINSGEIINNQNIAIRLFTSSAGDDNKVNVTIDGGKIEGSRGIWLQLAGSNSEVAPKIDLTINGGKIMTNESFEDADNDCLALYSYSFGNSFANTKVTIENGNFLGYVAFGGGYKGDQETVEIKGGTFTAYDSDGTMNQDCVGRYTNSGWKSIAH